MIPSGQIHSTRTFKIFLVKTSFYQLDLKRSRFILVLLIFINIDNRKETNL